jgi:hypothetical protein
VLAGALQIMLALLPAMAALPPINYLYVRMCCRIGFSWAGRNVMRVRNRHIRGLGSRRAAQIIACTFVIAATGWAISPGRAQPAASTSPSTALPKRAPFDEQAWRATQQAREQHIRTWGFAPGGQTLALPNSLPVSRWSSIGPVRISHGTDLFAAGRLNSIAIHPTNANIMYVGAADGGVWTTTDGGGIWFPLTDDQCSLHIGSVAIDPVNPSIVYAGASPGGVFKTTNGGLTWQQTSQAVLSTVTNAIAIDPVSPSTVYAGTNGSSVFRSTDGGGSWEKISNGMGNLGIGVPGIPRTITLTRSSSDVARRNCALLKLTPATASPSAP